MLRGVFSSNGPRRALALPSSDVRHALVRPGAEVQLGLDPSAGQEGHREQGAQARRRVGGLAGWARAEARLAVEDSPPPSEEP
ncbi:hypothetical protein D187_006806 [Cystobacter fuscus DSM 2262]|uniref:Uncharacterized protein n=1 Tax=Cystobacter fuscus (strain ATCC 25194 / DSM 2262 / NBRC 100088 / M29) TaxID=1242864 RepID=S9P4A5_CYSF2|nr:hypothetical protein D187_006806 [Cystobacter fuscus DSM 2262]